MVQVCLSRFWDSDFLYIWEKNMNFSYYVIFQGGPSVMRSGYGLLFFIFTIILGVLQSLFARKSKNAMPMHLLQILGETIPRSVLSGIPIPNKHMVKP